jgi:anti-sigma factor RsiW
MCDTEELIVGYVYDELSTDDRAGLERHLAACASCRIEVEELRATRGYLSMWKPPEPDLGFRVIGGGSAPAPALPLPRRPRFAPAFAFAAAAVIVLAVAAAIANLEVRYDNEGLTVRTGWAQGVDAGSPAPRPEAGVATIDSGAGVQRTATRSSDFEALDRRLREIEAVLSAPATGSAGVQMAASTTQRMSDAEMLRRVRELVREAEARQETAFAEMLLQVAHDFDQVRRADIAAIQQGLGQYQGLTNAEIAQNREMVNQLVRAASTRQEK